MCVCRRGRRGSGRVWVIRAGGRHGGAGACWRSGASGVVVVPRVVSHAGGGLLEALEVVTWRRGVCEVFSGERFDGVDGLRGDLWVWSREQLMEMMQEGIWGVGRVMCAGC